MLCWFWLICLSGLYLLLLLLPYLPSTCETFASGLVSNIFCSRQPVWLAVVLLHLYLSAFFFAVYYAYMMERHFCKWQLVWWPEINVMNCSSIELLSGKGIFMARCTCCFLSNFWCCVLLGCSIMLLQCILKYANVTQSFPGSKALHFV